MAEENKSTSYGNIFKTTFLFGFVQVFKAVVGVVKNKIAAIFLGADGMGILGIFNTSTQLLQTAAGLGVNQSAVRFISEANASEDNERISWIISLTNRIILVTGALGCLITICLSPQLSNWTFGNNTMTYSFCFLSVVVAMNIVNESKQAILKGMRQLQSLAKASMIGSATGLIVSAPLYFCYSEKGIIPVLVLGSVIEVLVSQYYLNKISYKKKKINIIETLTHATPMLKMGIALMFVTLLQTIVAFIINSYIRSKGGLSDVGYFSAGTTIINSYFGIVVTALMTDYYPRIAAINHDDKAIAEELNKQSIVSLVLCSPMFITFMVLMPFFIKFLYTDSFLPAVDFVKWSIYFSLITVCSNQVDMILIAKCETKVFLTIAVIFRMIQLILTVCLYSNLGLEGLGITYLVMGLLHVIVMCITVYYLYKIRFNNKFLKVASVVLLLAVFSSLVQGSTEGITYYVLSSILLALSIIYSYNIIKKQMQLDILQFLKSKLKK